MIACCTDDDRPMGGNMKADRVEERKIMKKWFPTGYGHELVAIYTLTFPVIVTQFFQFLIGPVALMFCGHLGELPLAGVALANSFISITALTIAIGFACACDTLFAQTYGSTNKKKLGVVLQRSILINLLAVFPCWAIHLNMEPLLKLLGQDPQVARIAAKYMLIFMPAVPCFFVYVCLSKYLQNQNILLPNVIIGAVVNAWNAVLQYLLVFVAGLGVEGSALGQVVTYFLLMFLTIMYIRISKVYKDTWEGISKESLMAWNEFARLGAFGLVMFCAEAWAFEIGIIVAGLLGTDYLGAMSVIFQLETFGYMIPMGTGIAASIRVGQYLGAGNAEGAQTAARVAMSSICILELGIAIIFLTLRNYLPRIFTDVKEVDDLVTEVLPILATYQITSGLAGVGAGILRGQGRQHLGAAIVISVFTTAIIAGSVLMLYTPFKLKAFWGGLSVALIFEGIIFSLLMILNNWENQASEALTRVKNQTEVMQGKPSPQEKTHLLNNEYIKNNLNSNYTNNNKNSKLDLENAGPKEKSENVINENQEAVSFTSIVHKRLLAVFFVLLIFVAGFVIRFTVARDTMEPLKKEAIDAPLSAGFNEVQSKVFQGIQFVLDKIKLHNKNSTHI